MEVLKGILGVIGVILLCLWYYSENVIPFEAKSLLDKLKSQFSAVKSGRVTYNYFKQFAWDECTRHYSKDTEEMTRLKRMLEAMLVYDDFIYSVFMEPHLTVDKLFERMQKYSPYAKKESSGEEDNEDTLGGDEINDVEKIIPEIFTSGIGLDLMNLMIENKHCEAGSLKWKSESHGNTTTLQGVFADAICKTLKLPYKGRYNYIKQIWGDKNFSEYLERAISLPKPEQELLLGIVRKVIINYELPIAGKLYGIPTEPYVLAQPTAENNP